MKRFLLSACLLSSQTLFAALPIEGFYSSIFGGYSDMPNNLDRTQGGRAWSHATYNAGYNVGGRLGYKSTPMRYEFEYTFVQNTLNNYKISGLTQTNPNGYTSLNLVMLNAYADLPGLVPTLNPFINFGLGYAFVNSKFSGTSTIIQYNNTTGSQSVFAYQGGAGIAYNFADAMSLDVAYRYVATQNVGYLGKAVQVNLVNAGVTYRFDEAKYK